MATSVGNESDIKGLVTNLIYLERDALAAYDASIDRVSDTDVATRLREFKQDHLQHLDVLKEIAAETGAESPPDGDMKEMLTTGKVKMAGMAGDGSVLKAMKTNEDDTVTAYERASKHQDAMPKSKAFFEKALNDELRHREWMETTSRSL